MVTRNTVRSSVPAHALPAFTPVPRKVPRHDGWTPARQKAFIEALADTGCVNIACRMVNMSQPSYYNLRRQPGAEGFRAAADAAHTLGLEVVKDEAFDRAMHGQLVPVFVAGKLMGFRRKKNDRLLMFILRHYGQDATGRRTTINYFSTRATAGAAANPPRDGEGDRTQCGGGGPAAIAAAESSTTTVKTVISGPANAPDPLAADTEAANLINAFDGVALDDEAQAEIYRALESCAERRRALAGDPDNDPECDFVRIAPGDVRWLGELESGAGSEDWVEYRPEGEHAWEGLGEGGEAERIDEVVAGIAARRAAMTPEELAAEAEADRAAVEARRAKQNVLPNPEPDPDDPRLDWRNWDEQGYTGPPLDSEGSAGSDCPQQSEIEPAARSAQHWTAEAAVEGPPCTHPKAVEGAPDPDPGATRTHKPRKPYKKRQPKPPFIPPDEARKAQAIEEVEAERREAAAAETERRKAKARRD